MVPMTAGSEKLLVTILFGLKHLNDQELESFKMSHHF